MDQIKDVLIVGAGPAGLTAAIYLKRAGYEPIIIDNNVPGGKVNLTAHVENYPGFASITGPDLAMDLFNHASNLGIKVSYEKIDSLKVKNQIFHIKTSKGETMYKSVIICSGTSENKLDALNANKYFSKGISYCAVCDGRFFKEKPVAVIGGGDSALEESLYLETLCKPVYLIHRRDSFRGSQILIDKVLATKNIQIIYDSVVQEVKGDRVVQSIIVKNVKTNNIQELIVNGVFPYVGATPNTAFLSSDVLNDKGYMKVNNNLQTTIPGLFGAGDVLDKALRQIVTAASDGAIAGTECAKYLKMFKKIV